jgi:hypothetical protein
MVALPCRLAFESASRASWTTSPAREARADAVRATTPLPATIALLVWNRCAASAGPREKKSAPIDQDETTAKAASRNGRRTTAGTRGRCTVSRNRPRVRTGSGMLFTFDSSSSSGRLARCGAFASA